MGFCILGGKENYLRKVLSDKLVSLGKTIGMGATPDEYAEDIQEIYDERYAAGKSDMTISGNNTSQYVSRTTNAAMSYNVPINNNYKYVMALCTTADTGAMIAHSATMSNTVLSITEQQTAMNIGGTTVYGVAKVMIGLASVAHSFSWPKDAWDFQHGLKIVYFN